MEALRCEFNTSDELTVQSHPNKTNLTSGNGKLLVWFMKQETKCGWMH